MMSILRMFWLNIVRRTGDLIMMNILRLFWLEIVKKTGDLIMMKVLIIFWLNNVRRSGENRMPFCLLCLHLFYCTGTCWFQQRKKSCKSFSIFRDFVDFNKENKPINLASPPQTFSPVPTFEQPAPKQVKILKIFPKRQFLQVKIIHVRIFPPKKKQKAHRF